MKRALSKPAILEARAKMADALIQSLQLRKAEVGEAARLAAIGFAAWEKDILPVVPNVPGIKAHERKRIRGFAEQFLDHITVAEFERRAIGWIARAPGRNYISFLFVSPQFQGRGVGSNLISRAESLMVLEGHAVARLDSPADHVRAVQFYQKHGYELLAPVRNSHHDGSLRGVRLEKNLNSIYGSQNNVE